MITKTKKVSDMFLSPSSINYFNQCQKKFWYRYFAKLPELPSIHLVKGIAIHSSLEKLFDKKSINTKNYKKEMNDNVIKEFRRKMIFTGLNMPIEEQEKHMKDGEHILSVFVNKISEQIEGLLINEKANSPTHAFHLLKPKFRELKLDDKELKVRGIVDTVQTDFDGNVVIVDYKTSNKYKNTISNDYILQLAIYAYLYKLKEKVIPAWLCINYLRFGESFYVKGTQDLVDMAIEEITKVRKFIIKYSNETDYIKNESKLCEYCSYYKECKEEVKDTNGKQLRLSI